VVDFFDRVYYYLRPEMTHKSLIYPLMRFLIRIFANNFLKYYFIFTKNNSKYSLIPVSDGTPKIIVSLTSFPKRINKLWMVIETILRQKQKPDRIILWLSKQQFRGINELPVNLKNQQKRGLEIRFCEDDLRSHKKYFYSLQEFKKAIVITVDDDVLYNSKIISSLIELHIKFPECVCCNHCNEITLLENMILPYKSWRKSEVSDFPSYKIFPIGVGGVLYPPNAVSQFAFNIDAIKSNCYLADDIWLNIMTKIAGNMSVSSNLKTFYLPVMYENNSTLTSMNVNEGLNDKQLENVRSYCLNKLSIDPFKYLEEINA
jgi:hypothetical protein